MTLRKNREYLSRVIMTRNELANAIDAQSKCFTGMVNSQSQEYISSVLAPISGSILSKLFKNTRFVLAGIAYSAWSLGSAYYYSMTKAYFRDVLRNGIASLSHLNTNWSSSWLAVEVEFVFLEVTDSKNGTARFFQGNYTNPKAGYVIKRVQTGGGWITL